MANVERGSEAMSNKRYRVSSKPMLAKNNYDFQPVPKSTNRVNPYGYRNSEVLTIKEGGKEVEVKLSSISPISTLANLKPISTTPTKKRIGNKAVTVSIQSI